MVIMLCACRHLARERGTTSRLFSTSISQNSDNHNKKASDQFYNGYEQFEESTPSPYKTPYQKYWGYETKIWLGGLLPRLDGPDVKKLPGTDYKPKDGWNNRRALFGQNDYIDILGDGDLHPRQLVRGPDWVTAKPGHNEFHRVTREMRIHGDEYREYRPTKFSQLRRRIEYLYKQWNYYRRDKT